MKVLMCGSEQMSQYAKNAFENHLKENAKNVEFNLYNRIFDEDELIEKLKDVDILVTWDQKITRRVIENSNLLAITYPSIGYDSVDIKAASQNNIIVTNVPTYCLEEVSNHAIMLMLSLSRKLKIAMNIENNWSVEHLSGIERFSNNTVGFIGFGKIAREIAKKLKPFGVKLMANDPFIDESIFEKYDIKSASLAEVLKNSNIISVNCNLNESSKNLISKDEFLMMEKNPIFINTARGEIVDSKSLIDAVVTKKIMAAGIDVIDKEPPTDDIIELSAHDNVIITPHMAYYSTNSNLDQAIFAARDVISIIRGNEPKFRVN